MKRSTVWIWVLPLWVCCGSARTLGFEVTTPLYQPVDVRIKAERVPTDLNPYDVVAWAVCTHGETEQTLRQLLFYDGIGGWVLRFTGTSPGDWRVRIESEDSRFSPTQGVFHITPTPCGSPGSDHGGLLIGSNLRRRI